MFNELQKMQKLEMRLLKAGILSVNLIPIRDMLIDKDLMQRTLFYSQLSHWSNGDLSELPIQDDNKEYFAKGAQVVKSVLDSHFDSEGRWFYRRSQGAENVVYVLVFADILLQLKNRVLIPASMWEVMKIALGKNWQDKVKEAHRLVKNLV